MKRESVFLMVFLIILVASSFAALGVQRVEASGTVYIRADGSIDPPYAPISTVDNVTYTLTGNITSDADGIVVERNNIVVDGSGFAVEGVLKLSSHGVYLEGRRNVTIKNTNIKNFNYGIWLYRSSYNSIGGNTITNNNWDGVSLEASSCTSIGGNIIANNSGYGIWFYGSSINSIGGNTITNNGNGIALDYISNYNNISGNTVTNNNYGILLEYNSNNSICRNTVTNNSISGILLSFSSNNDVSGNTLIDCSFSVGDSYANSVENNTINGKPLVYLEGVADCSVDEAGGVVLVRCDRIRVENLNLSSGVTLWETNNSIISGSAISNNSDGIYLGGSSNNNSISGNNIINNSGCGIRLADSANNSINRNNITNNSGDGIWLSSSSDNRIDGNNITDGGIGIWLYRSSNNSIDGNTIANSHWGISFRFTLGNTFCHNNFINNTVQVNDCLEPEQANFWDNGCEGNYWSNCNGTDANQDGIGDTAYTIYANNTDNYPLMGTYSSFNVTYFTPALEPHYCSVTVISNSTVSDFSAPRGIEHPEIIILTFYVTGEQGAKGFCRVSFPTVMMNDTYHVYVNGTEVQYTLLPCSDANTSYLYFNYTHSTQEVIITPEFPSFLILPLFFTLTLLAVIAYRRRHFYHAER